MTNGQSITPAPPSSAPSMPPRLLA
jgi:hypothetical protein